MVKITTALWQQLRKIMQSGQVDIQNPQAVIAYAEKQGFLEALLAVQRNPSRYLRCVNEGMEATMGGVKRCLFVGNRHGRQVLECEET